MSDHPFVVTLPDTLFDPLRQIAEARAQSVQEVIIDQLRSVLRVSLPPLPADEESELVAFNFLSDDTLRSIAREQMPSRIQERMQTLMARNTTGTLSSTEHEELSQLVERGERLMLRKAWAAGILMERGYTMTAEDFTPEDA